VFAVDKLDILFNEKQGHVRKVKACVGWRVRKSDLVHLVIKLNY
jgi:hypothetical protein